MAENKNLIQRLVDAMKEIKEIKKDGQNTYQKYTFQSEGAIKSAVKKALEENGIIIIPEYEIINQYDRTSSKGTVNHFVDVMGTFTITDGADSITGKMAGSGQDTGEKAVVKAETTAQKYFYKQLFNISDQEADPDSTNSGSFKKSSLDNEYQNLVRQIAQRNQKTYEVIDAWIKKQTPLANNMTPQQKISAMIMTAKRLMNK